MLLCPMLGRLSVWTWMCLPLLFLGSAAGAAALLDVLLHPAHGTSHHLTLSVPLLFGSAAGIALLSSGHVRWAMRWQLPLRSGYPLLMLGCALARDRVELPPMAALLIGVPAAALSGALLVRSRSNDDRIDCPTS